MNSTKSNPNIKIGNREIGDGQPCYVIAEIGSNHNQDYDLACRMIESAAKSGVDAVKFQTFKADSHYSKKSPGFGYLDNKNTHELIKSLELDRSWQGRLKSHAESCGVDFFSSPCDSDAIAGLAQLDIPAYKVASFDLTDDVLISEMAAIGKPMIMSTGMATWMDIQYAIDAVHSAHNHDIVLLQCTSLYPAPAHLSNLSAMATMRAAFGTLVGYSDHTMGGHVVLAAVALGASVIEKHFTLDRGLPGPDHAFAIEPHEMTDLMREIREVEAACGDGTKAGPRQEELEMAEKGRRSLHACMPIAAGQIIEGNMLVSKRPGLGIPPFLRAHVVGRKASRDIEVDDWITWDML
ncbi:N-acetylneuraminate synthase family protein [Castellaniella sp.]|uniref:N-acetylneuraminate synthase family protein n=1 Tax=Castellaniella sp. TaxID=1955812 RepID=UPI003A943D40